MLTTVIFKSNSVVLVVERAVLSHSLVLDLLQKAFHLAVSVHFLYKYSIPGGGGC
jgi:hypothetical protein